VLGFFVFVGLFVVLFFLWGGLFVVDFFVFVFVFFFFVVFILWFVCFFGLLFLGGGLVLGAQVKGGVAINAVLQGTKKRQCARE